MTYESVHGIFGKYCIYICEVAYNKYDSFAGEMTHFVHIHNRDDSFIGEMSRFVYNG